MQRMWKYVKKYIAIFIAAFVNIISIIEFYSKYNNILTALLYTAPICLLCLLIAFISLFIDFWKRGKALLESQDKLIKLKNEYEDLSKRHKAISSQYTDKKNENHEMSNSLQTFIVKWLVLGVTIDHASKDKKNNRIKEIQDMHKKLSENMVDRSSYKEK